MQNKEKGETAVKEGRETQQTEGLIVSELPEIDSVMGQRTGPSTAWKAMPTDLQEESRKKEQTEHHSPADCYLNSQTSSKDTKIPHLQNVARFG